jgi:hypothetical protein
MSVRQLVRFSAPFAALAALTVPAAAHPGHASVFGFDLAAGALAGRVSRESSRAALRVGGGAIAALGLVLVLV